MPLVSGHALSYSPLLYRPRGDWAKINLELVGDAVQPKSAGAETPERLDTYAERIDRSFASIAVALSAARVETLVFLTADHGTMFDDTNTPQVHVFVDDDIWGDVSRADLGETASRSVLPCDADVAARLADELVHSSFDIAESRGAFRPQGDPERGAGAAFVEPALRLLRDTAIRVVPVHVNAHVEPCMRGERMAKLGVAIARALAFCPQRVGIVASGGLSGDAGGYMAGWIDETLDRWVLDRLLTRRSAEIGRIFDMESLTLRGSSREIRLWAAAGAAMEQVGAEPTILDYIPFHHAAVGTGFMHWRT